MNMTDPIADMLTRIRNGLCARKRVVDVPASKVKLAILDALKREGFIQDYKLAEEGATRIIRVYLKYSRLGESVIQAIRRESKVSVRKYEPAKNLKPLLQGVGIAVVSTSKGILSDRECRKQNLGGEVICTVW